MGDGSIVNGLNLEALSNSTTKPKNFIVILNDNGMSISANKNGFYKLISKSTINKGYVKGKKTIKKLFGKSFITNFFVGIRNFVKRLFGGYNYFEQVGFKYVCGVDGNDLSKMVKVLQKVKELAKEKAVLLHIKTTKGKGYEKAEEFSDVYHGVGKNYKQSLGDFGKQLANKINSLISTDDKIVAITAGMKDGTGLSLVEQKFPKNFVDVGIAEEYAVTLAAGMAKGGLKPIVAIYSTFLQRAYDQILHDVCMQNLPVVFCIDRAGFVGEDGKTHQGLFDLSYLSHMPNMTILTPSDPKQFAFALDYALSLQTPVAIRYPKTSSIEVDGLDYQQGKCQIVEKGDNNFTILAVGGKMIKLAKEFSLVSKTKPTIVYVRTVKPFDKDLLQTLSGKVITLEENVLIGGFGSAVSACFSGDNNVKVYNVGVEDEFVKHGSIDSQMVQNNITIQRLLDIENFN